MSKIVLNIGQSFLGKSLLTIGLAYAFTANALADDVREYGEYLAGECTACHSTTGADKGIPSIIGWDAEGFIETLNYYKSGERDNPAMVDVARNLDDEQMKALAVYFGSLEEKEEEAPAVKPAAKPTETQPDKPVEKTAAKPADTPVAKPAATAPPTETPAAKAAAE